MHIKSYCQCFDYEINRDYLTNEKSTFTLSEAVNAEYGDFVLVKRSNDINNFLYCGVIDSFTENSMVTCDLYNIVNFEFAATRQTGSSSTGGFGGHIKNLLDIYLDNSKSIYGLTYTLDDSAKVAYSYQPSSPPTVTNMVDYLVNGFKKYNVTFEFDKIKTNSDNSIEIKMVIKKRNDRIKDLLQSPSGTILVKTEKPYILLNLTKSCFLILIFSGVISTSSSSPIYSRQSSRDNSLWA